MAFVVATKNGRFEVRESHATEAGPRSRTLVSFTEMDDGVIAKAHERAAGALDPLDLRRAAARAGAPVVGAPIERSARETLRRIASGEGLEPMLRALLLDALSQPRGAESAAAAAPPLSDSARAATQWMGTTLRERGEALADLLELSDALPVRVRRGEIGFPRLRSA
jgi:hypothetical protein